LSKQLKLKNIKTYMKPVAVYRIEAWAVTEMDMNRLSAWERKI
jgi:hypothetical protein